MRPLFLVPLLISSMGKGRDIDRGYVKKAKTTVTSNLHSDYPSHTVRSRLREKKRKQGGDLNSKFQIKT